MNKITRADIGRRVRTSCNAFGHAGATGTIADVVESCIRIDLDGGSTCLAYLDVLTFLDESADERQRIADLLRKAYFATDPDQTDAEDWLDVAGVAIAHGMTIPVEYVDGALYEITDWPDHVGWVLRRSGDLWVTPLHRDPMHVPDGCTFTRLIREGEQP